MEEKNKRLFKLDARLKMCADMIPRDCRLADIGTDHAYLPIWLIKTGKIKSALATDISREPLRRAKNNIEKYRLTEKIEVRLSDGLDKIKENEVNTIVIAGMGADTIISIIQDVSWLKDKNLSVILQPMTNGEKLRRFLKEERFFIEEERAVGANSKSYSVMKVVFSGEDFYTDELYPYVGKLLDNIFTSKEEQEATAIYIKKEIKNLKNRKNGIDKLAQPNKLKTAEIIIDRLERKLERIEKN